MISTPPILAVLILLAASPLTAEIAAPTPNADYLGLSRELLGKYYEMQKLLSKEEAEWKLGKDVLQSRVDLLESQLKELKTKTGEENQTITTTDTEREKLDARNQELLGIQEQQVEAVEKLEARVRKLWQTLPAALQTKVQAQFDGMPNEDVKRPEIKASVGERYLKVLAILNEVNKFHSDIHVVNERRKLKDGREVEVRAIYFGLGAAYFAGSDETANVAGMGVPGPDGWDWKEMPEIAREVDMIIGMNKGEKVAAFVRLPVQVR